MQPFDNTLDIFDPYGNNGPEGLSSEAELGVGSDLQTRGFRRALRYLYAIADRSSEVSAGHGLALLDGNLNRPPDVTGGVEPAPSATDVRTSSQPALGLGLALGRSKDACLEALVGSAIPTGAKLDYNQRSG